MDQEVLKSALDKIRGGEGDAGAALSEDESTALAAFLTTKSAEENLSDADHALCRHIRAVLQGRAASALKKKESPGFQRSNLALRAAIDVFLQQDFAALQEKELKLLRETNEKLEAMARAEAPSPNQIRLMRLIVECLESYRVWSEVSGNVIPEASATQAARQTRPEPTPPAQAAAGAANDVVVEGMIEAAAFLSQAVDRETLTELEGVPVSASVRRLTHEGNLHLAGEIGEDKLLDTHGGNVRVQGFLFGYLVADGDVYIDGSIQGGWVFSRNGSITVTRVLAGAVLIAPHGDINAGSLENPKLLYSGGDCNVEHGARSGVYCARNITVGDALRNAVVFIRGLLTAGAVEVNPQDTTFAVNFRAAQSCEDFGRPIPDSALHSLKGFGRIHFRRRVSTALAAYFKSELLNMQRVVCYAIQTGAVNEPLLSSLRSAHCEQASMTLLVDMGEALKELIAIGQHLGHGLEASLMNAGVEESAVFLAFFSREVKSMAREYIRDCESVESPGRHISSFAKKYKDALRTGQGADRTIFDFDCRLDEWRGMREEAAAENERNNAILAKVLGEKVWQVNDPARLGALLAQMYQSAEAGGKLPQVFQTREMAALRERVVEHAAHRTQWVATADGIRTEHAQALAALQDTTCLVLAGDGPCGVSAGRVGTGLRIQTLSSNRKVRSESGDTSLIIEGQDTPCMIRMENLRIFVDPTPTQA